MVISSVSVRSVCVKHATPIVMTIGAVVAFILSTPAAAQAPAPPATEGTLEEVVVSARFREEKLQETPLAITAVSGETLAARGSTDVTNLAAFVPNAVISPLGSGWGATLAANIRGVGLSDNSLSFEPGVPIYVDDVYLGRPQGAILDLLDLERVEVLRGPQGTLFGKNAVGGTVSLISKKPTGDGHGYVDAEFGSFNRRNFRGSYDVSVVPEKLFARVAFSSKRRDGYVDVLDFECVNGAGSLGNGGTGIPGGQPPVKLGSSVTPGDQRGCVVDHQGNENMQSGRLALRFLASDALEMNLVGDYTTQNQQGPPDQYTLMDPTNVLVGLYNQFVAVPVFGIPWDQRFLTNRNYTNYDSYVDPVSHRVFPNVNDMTEYGVSNVNHLTISPTMSLKMVTAYRRFSNSFGRDSDGSPMAMNVTWDTSNHHQFSEEITLTGTAAQTLDWTVGAFYYKATDSNQGFSMLYPGVPGFEGANFTDFDIQSTKNWAGFVHGVYHFTDKLSGTLGVRYTSDKKHAVINRTGLTGADIIPDAPVDVSATKVSPKAGLEYRFNPDLLGYIQYSTGFRGGGFGPRPNDTFQVRSFKPEDLKTGEVGMKSEWLDRRLRFNSAIFYSKYSNLQQGFNTIDPFGVPWFSTINVGASRIYGIEAEVLVEPVSGLRFQGSFGYDNYKVTDVGSLVGILCIKHTNGDNCVPPRTPKYTGGLSAEYSWAIGSGGSTFTLRGDSTYQSSVYFTDLTLNANPGQGGYSLYNARATWNSPDKAWAVSAFGTNLGDKVYYNGKLTLGHDVLGFEQGNLGTPRMWGLSFRRNF
jgi:iron complex outermembrane receptor protein